MTGWSITLAVLQPERDSVIAELWEEGTTGVVEEQDWIRAFFDGSKPPERVMDRFAGYAPVLERDEDHDWVGHARSMWTAFAAGSRFWLVPEWDDDPAPSGRLRLPMRPGMACGSGWHPATRLCLEAMERVVTPGSSVLDVGTGSGILAEAALLLGVALAAGCDIDHDATLVARRNVPGAAVFTGSVRSVRDNAVDVAIANLNAATLGIVSGDLLRVARRGLIVSGFREEETSRVEAAFGRPAQETLESEGWGCLVIYA